MKNRDIKMRVLFILENLERGGLKNLNGINEYSENFWYSLRRKDKNIRVNEEHLAALYKAFPQYQTWIATGLVFPDKGQISPEIEAAIKSKVKNGNNK